MAGWPDCKIFASGEQLIFSNGTDAIFSAVAQDVMGPKDDITHFSYTKKTSKDRGPVVIGIELAQSGDLESLERKMTENGFAYEYLNDKPLLFEFLV